MIKKLFVVTCLLLSGLLLSGTSFAQDDGLEPPRTYVLSMDGKKHMISTDNPVRLKGDYSNPEILLTASPFRLFPYGGVEFKYPAWFTWEADLKGDHRKTWVLSGNDFKIMYFIFPNQTSYGSYSKKLAKAFGVENTKISQTQREFGGERISGNQLLITIKGVDLVYEVYGFPSTSGSRLLVLQDKPAKDGTTSIEGKKALAMLGSSFKNTH